MSRNHNLKIPLSLLEMLCSRVISLKEVCSVNLKLAAHLWVISSKEKNICKNNFLHHGRIVWFKKKGKGLELAD